MTRTDDILLSLLRTALWSTPAELTEPLTGDEWREVIATAQRQTVVGLLCDAIGKLPEDMNPPGDIIRRLIMADTTIRRGHEVLNDTIGRMADLFDKSSVPYNLLKGQSYASHYPTPSSRQCGDIDVYVPPRYFDEAKAILVADGYDAAHDSVKHLSGKYHGCDLELHRAVAVAFRKCHNDPLSKFYEACASAPGSAKIGDREVRTLSPVGELFHVFQHMRHHFLTSGVGLRQFCDWTILLRDYSDKADVDLLRATLESLDLMRSWRTLIAIPVEYLGLPKEKALFYEGDSRKISRKVMDVVLDEGNFGKYNTSLRQERNPKRYWAYKLRRMAVMQKRYFRMVSILPRDLIEADMAFFRDGISKVYSDVLKSRR